MHLKLRILLSLYLILSGYLGMAQNKTHLVLKNPLPEGIVSETDFPDLETARLQTNRLVTRIRNAGYLAASLDTLIYKNDSLIADIYSGDRFYQGSILYKYLPPRLSAQFGFTTTSGEPFSLEKLTASMSRTIAWHENRGYPFAYFNFDSLVVRNDSIHGILKFEKNIEIRFDTLALYGDPGLSKSFLYNYLGFRPGDLYSETTFLAMTAKLQKLPLTVLTSKPMVFFTGNTAVVFLVLKKRKTDRLDGLIGFAPNTGTPGNTKLLVTGEFHLDFRNLKRSGTALKADWQSFRARSQNLSMSLQVPYILRKPYGVGVHADFLKYDTLYTETGAGFSFQYLFSGLDHFRLFYDRRLTTLQFADTAAIRSRRSLGDQTAMGSHRYGMGFLMNTFENRVNPRKGYATDISLSFFAREILKVDKINRVKFTVPGSGATYTIYDSTRLKTSQILIRYHLQGAVNPFKDLVLFGEFSGYHLLSPQIYFNELYRFGGNNTLRGFNEQSLFASSVSILNAEVRYLLSENTFARVFGNMALYEDLSSRQGRISSDLPWGVGAGINLETGAGLFNISVALGRSKYNPVEFKNAKVHFGIINYF